jgi:UDP-GlcNAc:undecaprenyl-phosphate GlcNAc-1-phosphate transferase
MSGQIVLGIELVLASTSVAFFTAVIFMVALRPLALRVGLLDAPGGRKFHEGYVPIIGGLAMFAGIYAGMSLLPFPAKLMHSIFIASALLVIVGTLDDKFHIPASIRIVSQIVAVLLMVYGAGLQLSDIGAPFGTGTISMGSFTLIFTTLVTLTMINAYNLVDGADGLAGTLTLIALLSVALVSGVSHPSATAALTVSGAIVGFLLFNFPKPWNRRVRSFMGDAGSTLLGFAVVWITLGVSQGDARVISPVHCLWFASIPIYDCLTCFVRRAVKGKSPFTPGRDHFHHMLFRGGFTVRPALAILTGLQLTYALIAIAAHFAGVADVVMFTAWSLLFVTQRMVIRLIGHYHRCFRLRKLRRLRAAAA